MRERPDLAGRVAWTYLATVLAAAGGGLVALVAYQVVDPLLCAAPTGDLAEQALACSLVTGMGLWVAGFAAALVGALALLRLERRSAAWCAMVAGLVWLLVGIGSVGQWWWILTLLLLPAVTALASAGWSGERRFRVGQLLVLAGLLVAGLAVFAWQVLAA